MSIGVAGAGAQAGGMAMAMGGAAAAGKKGLLAAGPKGGPQAAKHPLSAKGPQIKPQGQDFGRHGAVSRGQGFSQRDTFDVGKPNQGQHRAQAQQQTGAAGVNKPPNPAQQNPTAQQSQNQPRPEANQPSDASRREMQEFEAQVQRILEQANQIGMQRAMLMAKFIAGSDEDKDTLRAMYKKFQEWLKEMDAIFLQPSPG